MGPETSSALATLLACALATASCSSEESERSRERPFVVKGPEHVAEDEVSMVRLGLAGGLDLEYDMDSLRLVRVRRGAAAGGRASAAPLPREQLLDRTTLEARVPRYRREDEERELSPRFERAWIHETPRDHEPAELERQPAIAYTLHDGDSGAIARITESLRPIEMRKGWGFVRSFTVEALEKPCEVTLDLLHPVGESTLPGLIVSGPPSAHDWSLGNTTESPVLPGFKSMPRPGRAESRFYRNDAGLYQFLTRSRPRSVRLVEGSTVLQLDDHPIRFELAEQYMTDPDVFDLYPHFSELPEEQRKRLLEQLQR